MSTNNFNERLNDLHETLRILNKKSIQNNGLNGIDLEVIKFKLIHFYEEFLIKEDLSTISTQTPVREIEAAPESLIYESEQEETISIHANSILTPPMEATEIGELTSNINTSIQEEVVQPIEKLKEEIKVIEPANSIVKEELIQAIIEDQNKHLSAAEQMIQQIFATSSSNANTSASANELVAESPILNNNQSSSTGVSSKGLNDRFSHIKSNNSVNERFKTSTSENFSDRFHTQATSMSELLDLNKKLLFVTQLFGGNHELFQQVLKQIDSFTNANEAIMFMEHNKPKLNLSEKQEEIYVNFLETIKKKF